VVRSIGLVDGRRVPRGGVAVPLAVDVVDDLGVEVLSHQPFIYKRTVRLWQREICIPIGIL
jgi:hypothetical protein